MHADHKTGTAILMVHPELTVTENELILTSQK